MTYRTSKPLHVLVLMGGPSAERDISLITGRAIADAAAHAGHRVTRGDILPNETAALDTPDVDVVFIAMHGEFGESGEVQQLCEARGLRYVGSSPQASRLAMDKAATKQVVKRHGLPTPDWMIIEEYHQPSDIAKWLDELPPPVVVKPVNGGSSLDLTIAKDPAARDAAIDDLLDRYRRVMLERYIAGREFTVGIVADRTLPLLEIRPPGEFYDYRAKYADGAGTEYVFDHGLPAADVARIEQQALEIHNVLGCRDMSRVDFLLDEQGCAQFLEINTIPGFTGHSLLPMAAARAGIGFVELVDRLLMMAHTRNGLTCQSH